MFKFAFALGTAAEWLTGAPVHDLPTLAGASLRGFMLTLAAWMLLEFARMLLRAVETLEG